MSRARIIETLAAVLWPFRYDVMNSLAALSKWQTAASLHEMKQSINQQNCIQETTHENDVKKFSYYVTGVILIS